MATGLSSPTGPSDAASLPVAPPLAGPPVAPPLPLPPPGPDPPEAVPPVPAPLPPAPARAPGDDELHAASASKDVATSEWSRGPRTRRFFFIREASFYAAVAANCQC